MRVALASIVLAVLAAAVIQSAIPAAADSAAIHRAVERSLPLLQSSADTWLAKRQCASCHHQTLGVMAVTVARERGYTVNEALVPAQTERLVHSSQNWLEPFVTGEVSINEAIGQSYRAVGFGAAGGVRTAKTDAMVYLLAGRQHASGFWPVIRRFSWRPVTTARRGASTCCLDAASRWTSRWSAGISPA
jgi:hypothetical protein